MASHKWHFILDPKEDFVSVPTNELVLITTLTKYSQFSSLHTNTACVQSLRITMLMSPKKIFGLDSCF